MHKLLCIVGPTGTGKTQKAIELASKEPSILVSADSRQVYRGMDIVTGKDHPANVPIFGIDIVDPDQSISVAVWHDAVIPHIQQAWDKGKQVIVVGGTGLYVKALTQGIPTMSVPLDQPLRDQLAALTVAKLQDKLKQLDEAKLTSMNHSDSNNPRRLTRAIEIAQHRASHPERAPANRMGLSQAQIIGLKYYDNSNYGSKVRQRVRNRLAKGALRETELLLAKYGERIQSLSAIGYRSIIKYLKHESSEQQMVDSWVADELAYAKRQMTWFRKQPVIWYDIDAYGNSEN